MDLFKQLETALQTTAAQVVEGNLLAAEFPVGRTPAGPPRAPLSAAANATVATNAVEAWTAFGMDGRRAALRHVVEQLREAPGDAAALRQVLELAAALLALPDPSHALEAAAAAAKRTADLESEVRQLQRDLKAVRADDKEVQELVEAHEREKADNARMRAELEDAQADLATLRSAAGSSTAAEAQLNAKAEEVERLQAALTKLRGEYDDSQTQLFDALAQQEAVLGSSHSADDVVALDELDRLRRQVSGLSAQRAQLQQQVRALQEHQQQQQQQQQEPQKKQQEQHWSQGGELGEGVAPSQGDAGSSDVAGPGHGMLSPRSAVMGAARDAERQQARADLETAFARLREAEHQNRLLDSRVNIAEAQAARLQAEVARRPAPEHHAEVSAAVAALSTLLGKQLEQEGWQASAAQAAVSALASDPSQLQSQLQERVLKLSDALGAAGREAEAARVERDAAMQQVEALRAELTAAHSLVQQLEGDLALAAACSSAGGWAGGGERGGIVGDDDGGPSKFSGPASAAELAAVFADSATATSSEGGPVAVDAGNLLPVVVRQRDRFAARVAELEESCGQQQARATELQGSLDKLTADNVELVKQIRYLKHRQLASAAGGAGGGAPGEPRATIIRVDSAGVAQQEAKAARYSCGPLAFEVASRRRRQQLTVRGGESLGLDMGHGGAEAKYAQQYERSVNPFADFQKAEVEGRVRNLKLHDRVMFAAGSLIAGSSMARIALFAYLVLLHVFVMVTTYSRALSSGTHCTTN